MAPHIELTKKSFFFLLFLAVLILGGVLLVVYLPSATITVLPTQEARTITQEITLSNTATEPDFVRYILPAKIVEKEIEDSATITRTDIDATEDFATGIITLKNEQDDEQPLLPQSHVRHQESGVQFLTDAAVRIPPQGEVQVRVTAKEKGSVGNVGPGTFVVEKLPESLQKIVYGESSQTFSGGIATSALITEQEIVQAKQALSDTLKEQALGELTLEARGAAIMPELIQVETLTDESSVEPGSSAATFEVRQKIRVRGFVVDRNDLLSLTLLALRGSQSTAEEFSEYDPATFRVTIDRADFARGQVRITGSLQGTFVKKIEPSVLGAKDVIGLGKQEIIEHFQKFESIEGAEVEFSPFWVQSLPARPSATEIIVKNASAQ